ncbi:MAG: redoxin domain-containing protein [Chloroflexi bacterium]|nr:redoxin domain-containing protein [Chloroflexota bacterium]
MELTLWLAFIAGLVSFVSPCVLPLVPAYIGYMGGRVTNTVAAQTANGAQSFAPTLGSRFSTVVHGLAFVGGFTFVFVAIGLLSTAFINQIGGENLFLVTNIIGRVGGVIIIVFGLHFMGVVPSLLNRFQANLERWGGIYTSLGFAAAGTALIVWGFMELLLILPVLAVFWLWLVLDNAFVEPQGFWARTIQRIQTAFYSDTRRQMVASGQQSYASSAVMGVVFSAGWTPCIGPIYGAILTMSWTGTAGEIGQAGTLLVAYSLGLGIPFLLTALMLDSAQGVLRGLQRNIRTIELVSGTFLVLIGVLIASNQLQALSQRFANEFAEVSFRMEECALHLAEGDITLGEFIPCINDDGSQTVTVAQTQNQPNNQAALAADANSTPSDDDSAAGAPLDAVGDITGLANTIEEPVDAPAALEVGTGLGQLAPNFTSVDDSGEPFELTDYRGQVVLLNFWATWCGPCRIEMPDFEEAWNQHADDGFAVIAVNNQETIDDVLDFRAELELTFPMVMDEVGEIQRQYGVLMYPSTYILDADGVIITRHFGPLTSGQITEMLAEALS